jgi:type II secretory pathway predicted ATPase ExeA
MYLEFFGLRAMPFELTSDPRHLYRSAGHAEVLANLQYGLSAAKAVTLIIGEAGTGKTTLLNAALSADMCRGVRCVCISNPTLTRSEFIELLAMRFGLSSRASQSKAVLLSELETVIRERRTQGEITALIVDEAQSLSVDILEELRLLANLESGSSKLLPLVFIGQPELAARLENGDMRQLKQRIALRCDLLPFTLAETVGYIATRIGAVGGDPTRLFTREALILIHEHSRGIARTINVLSDNVLVHAFALGRSNVDSAMVLEVCRDFRTTPRGQGADRPDTEPAAPGAPNGAPPVDENTSTVPRIVTLGRRVLREVAQANR